MIDAIDGGFLEIPEGLVFFKHLHDWGMCQIVIEDEWLGWMATEVVKEMQGSKEVRSAGHIHEVTKTPHAENLLVARA